MPEDDNGERRFNASSSRFGIKELVRILDGTGRAQTDKHQSVRGLKR